VCIGVGVEEVGKARSMWTWMWRERGARRRGWALWDCRVVGWGIGNARVRGLSRAMHLWGHLRRGCLISKAWYACGGDCGVCDAG